MSGLYIGIDPGYNLGFAVVDPVKKKIVYNETIDCRQFKTKLLQGVSFIKLYEDIKTRLLPYIMDIEAISIEDSTVIKQYNHQAVQSLTGTKIAAIMAYESIFYKCKTYPKLNLFKPSTIKKEVVKRGNATKEEVMLWVNNTYKLNLTKKDNHVSDAIAIAHCGYLKAQN
jgi:Holliday junction resolvasome RuvABC endonuclease subunit